MDWEPWHRVIFFGVLFVVLISFVCYCTSYRSSSEHQHGVMNKLKQFNEVNEDTITPSPAPCEDALICINDETPHCQECHHKYCVD